MLSLMGRFYKGILMGDIYTPEDVSGLLNGFESN